MSKTRFAALVAAAALLAACGTDAPAAPARPPAPTPEPVRVTSPSLVVNKDGSAAVTADLDNVQDSETSLVGVTVLSGNEALDVLTTQMTMPLPPNTEQRMGYATDAGGFVVPRGVSVPGTYRLVFSFDNGTCTVVPTDAVSRSAEHRAIYPTTRGFAGAVPSAQASPQGCVEG